MSSDTRVSAPDHEIKLLLRADRVLEGASDLVMDLVRAFDVADEPKRMAMQFVDTPAHALDAQGWIVRLRRSSGANGELTFKRRFPATADAIDATWDLARSDRFTDDDDYYKQVEWSRAGRTLSFSRNKDFDAPGDAELGLPGLHPALALVLDELPGRLRGSVAVASLSATGRLFGPVRGRRFAGEWRGSGLRIECWRIGPDDRPVVELSCVERDYFAAKDRRDALVEYLQGRDWLEVKDVSKTKLILELGA